VLLKAAEGLLVIGDMFILLPSEYLIKEPLFLSS